MTAPTEGQLHFGLTHAPVGFTSAAVAQFDGSAEPVVRELIQNSLDAADKAGRAANIRFTIADVASDELPGWSEYVKAFTAAKKERNKRGTLASHDEKLIVERINDIICRKRIPVLRCADNGCGLNPQRMIALLTVGNTDKGKGGAGAFGLGHHAAFGASDLRYVLYGSRYSRNGSAGTIASGHAILASRPAGSGELLAPDGYWRKARWKGHAWQDGSEFPDKVPSLLSSDLPENATGTVVAIAGFNDFRRDDDEATAEAQIMRVATANFCVAIDEKRLTVEVLGRDGTCHVADRTTLNATLEAVKDSKRASKQGQIAGAQAHAAWLTLRDKRGVLTPLPGVTVTWRSLDAARGEQTQVHVFRKGMWISSRVERLLKRDFASSWPFDAVVTLSDGELEKVVRASEGPEHRGIDRKRLTNEQKRLLRNYLATVADALREAVGERDDEEEYTPESFAILDGHRIRKAEKVRRPRRTSDDGSNSTPVNGNEMGKGNESSRNGVNSKSRHAAPRPGSMPKYRYTLRCDPGAGIVEVHLAYDEDTDDQHSMGIRLRRASGADGTCEQPSPDDYLRFAVVGDSACAVDSGDRSNDATEVELPAVKGERTLRLMLVDGEDRDMAVSPHLLSVDIVRRQRPRESDGPTDPADGPTIAVASRSSQQDASTVTPG